MNKLLAVAVIGLVGCVDEVEHITQDIPSVQASEDVNPNVINPDRNLDGLIFGVDESALISSCRQDLTDLYYVVGEPSSTAENKEPAGIKNYYSNGTSVSIVLHSTQTCSALEGGTLTDISPVTAYYPLRGIDNSDLWEVCEGKRILYTKIYGEPDVIYQSFENNDIRFQWQGGDVAYGDLFLSYDSHGFCQVSDKATKY